MHTAPQTATAPRAPGPPGGLRGLVAFRRDPGEFMLRMQRDHGPVSRLQIGPFCGHLVAEPEAVQRVLIDNRRNYRRGRIYAQFKSVMGTGLLTMDDDDWRPHRRAVQPAFQRGSLEQILPYVVDATTEMLDRWEVNAAAGKPIDLVTEMLWVTLVSLSGSLFGYDIRGQATEMKTAVDESIEIMFKHGYLTELLPRWVPTQRNRAIARNRALMDGIVAQVRRNHAQTRAGRLVELCEQAQDPDSGARWTDQQIRDELLTIYLAGHETTALGLCWTLSSVATRPAIAGQLAGEARAVLEGRAATMDDLDSLPYAEMVISESLRMYPPIWAYPRDLVDDDVLGGYLVPGGSTIILSPLVSHRNPDVWPNPEAFDPERFRSLDTRARPGVTYWPFGAGGRQCIGNVMAMMEMKIIVSMVAQRFDLHLVPGRFIRYGDSVISLRPVGDMLAVPVSRTRDRSATAAAA